MLIVITGFQSGFSCPSGLTQLTAPDPFSIHGWVGWDRGMVVLGWEASRWA